MRNRTVEQIMRVRKATAECKAVCEEATASFRASNPMRQPRDPAIVALCQPVRFQTMFGDHWAIPMTEAEYHAAINAMLPAEEYDARLRSRLQAKGRAA